MTFPIPVIEAETEQTIVNLMGGDEAATRAEIQAELIVDVMSEPAGPTYQRPSGLPARPASGPVEGS